MPAQLVERGHGPYLLSTNPAKLDLDAIHRFLSEDSYWAVGRSREVQDRAIAHSHLVIGAYTETGEQVGFARMVTDLATFAYLCDVFVLAAHRGGGLGTAMVAAIVEHPDVVSVGRQMLATADAHGLYARFGYLPLNEPARWMARLTTR